VLGITDAVHAEYGTPGTVLINLASCEVEPGEGDPRVKGLQRVRLQPDSFAAGVYGRTDIEEPFHCSYGLDPEHQHLFDDAGLRIVGMGDAGEARVVELAGAAFYVGTLFLPQAAAAEGRTHPLIDGFVAAVGRQRMGSE
jgi:CTP synthase